MNSVEYKDQSAAELRLHVIADWGDFQQFQPLAVARLERPRLHLQAGIIGASHIVQLSYDGKQHLSEVLACTDMPPDVPVRCSKGIMELSQPIDFSPGPGIHYYFESQCTDSQAGHSAFHALIEHIAQTSQDSSQSSRIGLDYSFPTTPRGAAPQTLVLAMSDQTSRYVTIRTAHSYPNEDTIVFSETHVTFSVQMTG